MSLNLFSHKLTELMLENNLTQQDLASKLSVTQQTISRWRKGQREPELDFILRLSNIFNVDPNELLGYNDLSEEAYIDDAIDNDIPPIHVQEAYEEYEREQEELYKKSEEYLIEKALEENERKR